jgi:hypothetical protein
MDQMRLYSKKLNRILRASLYFAAFGTFVFYASPILKHHAERLGSHALDLAFHSEQTLSDPFLRGDSQISGYSPQGVAAPPYVENTVEEDSRPMLESKQPRQLTKKLTFERKPNFFGPLESSKKFVVKERSYGTLWIIAKNSAAHQFECFLESPSPKEVKLKVASFEQGCEIQYNVGKPIQKNFELDVLVENKSGVRLLSENEISVVPRKPNQAY